MSNRKDRTQALAARSRFRMDDLQVQPDRLVVIRDGAEIKLELRMMEVLVFLAEHSGETMSTERLLIEIWEGAFYGDNPVNKTISVLRSRIGDDSRTPRYIETVSKVGYRLIAAVTLPEDYRRVPADSDRWTAGSPYVGLSAFDDSHTKVFCGRGGGVTEVVQAMRNQIDNRRRFVLMVGSSGCGKTSLLRAGVIPRLVQPNGVEGLEALSVASCDLAAAQAGDMLSPLAAALSTWTLEGRPVMPPLTPEQLRTRLVEAPEAIHGYVDEAFRRCADRRRDQQPHAHLLLTIDHAEALVAGSSTDAGSIDRFSRALQAICACPRVLAIMLARLDFYPRLSEALPALVDLKAGGGHIEVFTPRYGEIGDIIRIPAWRADLSFEKHPETNIRLDDVLRDATRFQPDALPLLQHTLQTLYEHRTEQGTLTFAAYEAIGGLEGAIAHRAEEVFLGLPGEVRESLDTVLTKIVNLKSENDPVSARHAGLAEFGTNARMLVDAFIDARLFVTGLQQGRPIVGVTHEALLRQWPRAVEWFGDNQRLLQAKLRLMRSANRWAEDKCNPDFLLNAGRPLSEAIEVSRKMRNDLTDEMKSFLEASEKQSNRRRNLRNSSIFALVALTVFSFILAIVSIRERRESELRQEKKQKLMTYMLGPLADKLRTNGDYELLESIGTEAMPAKGSSLDGMEDDELVNAARAARSIGEALYSSGEKKTAFSYFNRAKAASDAALRNKPKFDEAIFERGNASFWIGLCEYSENRYEQAESHWKDYLSDSRMLVEIDRSSAKWIREESYALNNLGTLEFMRGRNDRALALFSESTRKKQIAILLSDNDENYRFDHIDSRSWISRTLQAQGKLQQASAGYDNQIKMLMDLIKGKKSPGAWKARIANYLQLSASLEIAMGHTGKAAKKIDESIAILAELHQSSPNNNEWSENLVRGYIMATAISRARGATAEANFFLDSARSITESTPPEKRSTAYWRLLDARIRFELAKSPSRSNESARKDALEDMRSLWNHDNDGEIALEYARMLVDESLISYDRMQSPSPENLGLAEEILQSAKLKTDIRWRRMHVETHVLRGDRAAVKSDIDYLSIIGYQHPDYMKIIGTTDAGGRSIAHIDTSSRPD